MNDKHKNLTNIQCPNLWSHCPDLETGHLLHLKSTPPFASFLSHPPNNYHLGASPHWLTLSFLNLEYVEPRMVTPSCLLSSSMISVLCYGVLHPTVQFHCEGHHNRITHSTAGGCLGCFQSFVIVTGWLWAVLYTSWVHQYVLQLGVLRGVELLSQKWDIQCCTQCCQTVFQSDGKCQFTPLLASGWQVYLPYILSSTLYYLVCLSSATLVDI